MKRYSFIIILLLVVSCTRAQVSERTIALAGKFHYLLTHKNYTAAVTYFDSIVGNQVSDDQLEQIWDGVIQSVGEYRELTGKRTEKIQVYNIVYLTCRFEKTTLDMKLVFNKKDEIAGFFFVSPKPNQDYELPDYAKENVYKEKEIEVITGEYCLPGILTFPVIKDSYPLVILVHGSGPNDRDETIGPNKPFKDLAAGLASMGIASIRYDKRTLVYGHKLNIDNLTLEGETISDVISIIEMAGKMEQVSSVFVLGHSLGAYAAPRIADRSKDLDGIIMMAGNSRPLEELILEQVLYIFSLDGLSDQEKQDIDELKEKTDRIKQKAFSEDTPMEELPLVGGKYWLYLCNYNQVEEAKKITVPILVLQGERDYQVTMKDFQIWKQELKEKGNVTFKSYPKLNHLFLEGEGKSVPDEYQFASNIPEYVIEDISGWIHSIILK